MGKPRVEIESEEMLPFDLERLMIASFSKNTTETQLRQNMRKLIHECQRLQGALLIERLRMMDDLDGRDAADEIDRLRAALQSIADNTCCEGCQEAAKWARDALNPKPVGSTLGIDEQSTRDRENST